jgi:hypothetical protein
MTASLSLLPIPRQIEFTEEGYKLSEKGQILLDGPQPADLLFTARRFQESILKRLGLVWEIVTRQDDNPDEPADSSCLRLDLDPERDILEQGYNLEITPEGVLILGRDAAGIFYGVCTLIQIVEQCGKNHSGGDNLPGIRIHDWPDFPNRGVMWDISRDKVPTMETLRSLVDMLASWKINQFQLYTEHTFAYQRHPEIWSDASPLTAEEIFELDAYCTERYIQLVPNQNSFGHMKRWLNHPNYASLAETNGPFDSAWGPQMGPFSLCPIDPGSLALVRELYDELLPNFSSRLVNVGCDETIDLGQGRSRDICELYGPGRVYLDYLLSIYDDITSRGFTMQFWGDIVLSYPDLVPMLPRDAIALVWGYEASHPFEEQSARFSRAGIPFYVCPGTSTWNSLAGRTENALSNLLNAAESGLRNGATGYLITDWGDNGHWQFLPFSYIPLVAGASYAWALETNREQDVAEVAGRYAFRDRAGVMGRLAFDLGNVHLAGGQTLANAATLIPILQQPLGDLRVKEYVKKIDYPAVLRELNQVMQPLGYSDMEREDAALILREFELTERLLRHACARGSLVAEDRQIDGDRSQLEYDLQEIITDYRSLWLERNRPGGLNDSAGRLEKLLADYVENTQQITEFSLS